MSERSLASIETAFSDTVAGPPATMGASVQEVYEFLKTTNTAKAYLKAPFALVEQESNVEWFLKHASSSQDAAKCMVDHWNYRLSLFLRYEPVHQGLLTAEAMAALKTGWWAFLDQSSDQWVILEDSSRLIASHSKAALERAAFYMLMVAVRAQPKHGLVWIRLGALQPDFPYDKLFRCMPIHIQLCDDAPAVIKDVKHLPRALGGRWTHAEFDIWLIEQRQRETMGARDRQHFRRVQPTPSSSSSSLSSTSVAEDKKIKKRKWDAQYAREKRRRDKEERAQLREQISSLENFRDRLEQESKVLQQCVSDASRLLDLRLQHRPVATAPPPPPPQPAPALPSLGLNDELTTKLLQLLQAHVQAPRGGAPSAGFSLGQGPSNFSSF